MNLIRFIFIAIATRSFVLGHRNDEAAKLRSSNKALLQALKALTMTAEQEVGASVACASLTNAEDRCERMQSVVQCQGKKKYQFRKETCAKKCCELGAFQTGEACLLNGEQCDGCLVDMKDGDDPRCYPEEDDEKCNDFQYGTYCAAFAIANNAGGQTNDGGQNNAGGQNNEENTADECTFIETGLGEEINCMGCKVLFIRRETGETALDCAWGYSESECADLGQNSKYSTKYCPGKCGTCEGCLRGRQCYRHYDSGRCEFDEGKWCGSEDTNDYEDINDSEDIRTPVSRLGNYKNAAVFRTYRRCVSCVCNDYDEDTRTYSVCGPDEDTKNAERLTDVGNYWRYGPKYIFCKIENGEYKNNQGCNKTG